MATAVYQNCLEKWESFSAQAEDWVKDNPTTVKAIATAGIVFGGVFLAAATTSFISSGMIVTFLILGASLTLVSSIADVYAEHHFQRMIQGPSCPGYHYGS